MAYSKASLKAANKYIKNNLEDIKIRVPKGDKALLYKRVDDLKYSSFNQFAIQAITEKLFREETIKNEKPV